MNALQVIPPKPAAKIPGAASLFRVAATILLLVLGRMSMSRGEDGIAPELNALAEMKDNRDKVGDNESPPVAQPAAASAAATTEDSRNGGSEDKGSTPAQPIAQSDTSVKIGSEPEKPAAPETKSGTASGAAINDGNIRDRNSGRALAKPPTIPAASAEPVRRAHQAKGQMDYRRSKAADSVPVWVGPPPIIYGPSPEARAPYAIRPADGTKRQDLVSLATVRGTWERVVEAPGAVLNTGRQALYGILDAIW
jgi:hypothetical protein